MSQVRVAILGVAGRMGLALVDALPRHAGLQLGAVLVRPGSALVGKRFGEVIASDQLEAVGEDFDVVVDFTRPEVTLAALPVCIALGKPMVIGTTGFSEAQKAALAEAARSIPLCVSGNFSIGINLLMSLVEQAAAVLGPGFDIEVLEAHHRHKVDAPSGTALMLGEAAARGAGRVLSEHAVWARHGHTGARDPQAIGFSTIRGGDVVGDHSVMFLGDGERVELAHRASSRGNFANGALRAAAWLSGRAAGLYSMKDVISGG